MKNGTETFTNIMHDAFAKNARFLLKRPAYLKTFSDITAKMNKQSEVRKQYAAEENLIVPPVLIVSITNDCNLSCKGCYACEQHRDKTEEMTIEQIDRIIGEAVDLGVAVVLIAGGEPLMKEGILELPKKYPSTLFVMFTNGLLIREA
jgi:MoaA/NifB/PqqE/SkfB family radical SAM enzyme